MNRFITTFLSKDTDKLFGLFDSLHKFEFELHRDRVSKRGNKLGVANLIRPNFNANFLVETIILKQSNFPIIVTEVC